MAIYWLLHSPLTKADWVSAVQGWPSFFYNYFDNLVFVDISELGIYEKAKKILFKNKYDLFDVNMLKHDRYIVLKKKSDVINFIKKTERSIFVIQHFVPNNDGMPSNITIKLLNKYNKDIILLFHWYTRYNVKKNMTYIFKSILKRKRHFVLLLLTKISCVSCSRLYFPFIFLPCKNVLGVVNEYASYGKIIPANSLSYDEYIHRFELPCLNGDYYVYIDQGLTIHKDSFYCSRNDRYMFHHEITNSLSNIEAIINKKIVIAGHPRCSYSDKYWNGREIHFNKSYELIDNSKGVIGHFSTILSYAWLKKKDMILLTSKSNYFLWDHLVQAYANIFPCKVYDMNTGNMDASCCCFNNDILIDHFTYKDSNKTNMELLSDFLSQYNK